MQQQQQQQQQPTIAQLDAEAAAVLQRMKDLADALRFGPRNLRPVTSQLQDAIEREAKAHVKYFTFEGETQKDREEAYARRVSVSRANWMAHGYISPDVLKYLSN